ncbi:MAG: hypothetical protein HRT38_07125 [Alteromonadaceae bacterium]|nr:hypothetical protein [Alteromonadaceae bacterium]
MKKTLLNASLALLFSATSFVSNANDDMFWGGGFSATKLTENGDSHDISYNLIYGRFGTTFNEYFALEGRLGFGVGSDKTYGNEFKLSNYYGAYLRADL